MIQFCVIIFLVAVVIPQAILAVEPTQGTLLYINPRTARTLRTPRAARDVNYLQCPPDVMGPVCSSDCRTIMTCISGNLISSSRCSDSSIDNPYCIPNTFGCTDVPDLSYETCAPREPPAEFTCTGEGYFPSPRDCNEYFFCTHDSVYKYACPPNYTYDSFLNVCRYEYTCEIIDCAGTPNKFVAHPANQAFYGFCAYEDGITQIIMFRCDHSETHIFNPDKVNCEFKCRSEGWFWHETNPRDFYECYYSNGVLVHRIQSCPEEYYFDAETKRCVRESRTTEPFYPTTNPPAPTDPPGTTGFNYD